MYEGRSEKEISEQIREDENELLEYLRTGNENGVKCFVFQGFMLSKRPILAAQFKEPEF